MFNRDNILKCLNDENYYVDKHSLALFLHDWKLDSIYEDENGVEFYDALTLQKIKKGISLKARGYSDEQIIVKLSKMEPLPEKITYDPENNRPVIVRNYNPDIKPEVDPLLQTQQKPADVPAEVTPPEIIPAETSAKQDVPDVRPDTSFTLDVTSQTLQMLAEAVAKKISDDITNSDMAQKLIEAGGYKRDNEILAKQVQELLEHNKELTNRIELLESQPSKTFWSRFWGQK